MADRSEDEKRQKREVFTVPDEHRAGILEGLEQAERGEFACDAEMAALWKRCGL